MKRFEVPVHLFFHHTVHPRIFLFIHANLVSFYVPVLYPAMTDTPFANHTMLSTAELAALWSSFAELLPAFVLVLFVGHTLLGAAMTTATAKEQPSGPHDNSAIVGSRAYIDALKNPPNESYKKKPLGDKTNATTASKSEPAVTKPTAAADAVDSSLVSTPKENPPAATNDTIEPPPILSVVTTDTAASTVVVVSPHRSSYTDTVTWTRNVRHKTVVGSPRCHGYTVTWTRNVQNIKGKLSLATNNASVRSTLNPKVSLNTNGTNTETTTTSNDITCALRSPEEERQATQALGDILIERIRQENPTLLQTVSSTEWETLLSLPMPVLAEILQQLEEHLERCERVPTCGAILEWEDVQMTVRQSRSIIDQRELLAKVSLSNHSF